MGEERQPKVSIMGDSISTYMGFNPKGYAVYYDENYQTQTHLTDVSLTWWHRVITNLGGTLCVNNSYSGSMVSGGKFPSGSSAERIEGPRSICWAISLLCNAMIFFG